MNMKKDKKLSVPQRRGHFHFVSQRIKQANRKRRMGDAEEKVAAREKRRITSGSMKAGVVGEKAAISTRLDGPSR